MNAKKNRRVSLLLSLICIIAVIINIQYYLQNHTITTDDILHTLLIVTINFAITYLLQINAHELGHFIAGHILKYSFVSYQVGNLAWVTENRKVKFKFQKGFLLTSACVMVKSQNTHIKKHRCVFFFGSVITNFVVSLITLTITLINLPTLSIKSFIIVITINLTLLIYFLIEYFPVHVGQKYNDLVIGYGLLMNKGYAINIDLADSIYYILLSGTRPSEVEMNYDIHSMKPIDPFYSILMFYQYLKALDLNNKKAMRSLIHLIETNVNISPISLTATLYYELLYYYSCIEFNHKKAVSFYKKVDSFLENDFDINGRRVLAAYEYYINHDIDKALACIAKAIVTADLYPLKGQVIMEKDLVTKLQRDIATNQYEAISHGGNNGNA